jgi:hypothetical protein
MQNNKKEQNEQKATKHVKHVGTRKLIIIMIIGKKYVQREENIIKNLREI